jgi:hypothetical protein
LENVFHRGKVLNEIIDHETLTRHRTRTKLVEAVGAFIKRYQWDHWCTLTSDTDRDSDALGREFRAFVRAAGSRAGGSIRWLYVLEPHSSGILHAHAFLFGTSGVPTSIIQKGWRAGFSKIVVYDRDRAASYYTAKAVTLDGDLEWHFSNRLPPEVSA